jgi:hypothetical protein
MTKQEKYRIAILIALCSVVWIACKQERQICLTPKIAILNIQTMHLATPGATTFSDTGLPHAVFAALTDSGTYATLYQQQAAFTVSLSPVKDSCRWLMVPDTLSTIHVDTLTFYYQRDLQFVSNACGYTYFYNLDSVHTTHSNIDSVHITSTSVTNNVNTKHLQIYIHPNY